MMMMFASQRLFRITRRVRSRLSRRSARVGAAAAGVAVVAGLLPAMQPAAAAPGVPRHRAHTAGWPGVGSWPVAGGSNLNTRDQPAESLISTRDVSALAPDWIFKTSGAGVGATPVEADGVVYYPDLGGYVYAIDAATGRQIWAVHL